MRRGSTSGDRTPGPGTPGQPGHSCLRPGILLFLVEHGTHDETVPYHQAELLAETRSAGGTDVVLRTVAVGRHNMLPGTDLLPTHLARQRFR